jgi:hypothetical protein
MREKTERSHVNLCRQRSVRATAIKASDPRMAIKKLIHSGVEGPRIERSGGTIEQVMVIELR